MLICSFDFKPVLMSKVLKVEVSAKFYSILFPFAAGAPFHLSSFLDTFTAIDLFRNSLRYFTLHSARISVVIVNYIVWLFFYSSSCSCSDKTVEELECLGEWKEGSVRYLVGKLQHLSAKTDEDKFRCFVFERLKDETSYQIAQSGDATCDGIFSPTEGSRTLKLSKTDPISSSCYFPTWLSSQRHWKTLDGLQVYDFSKNNSFRAFNATSAEALRHATCVREETSSEAFSEFVVHSVAGW